MVGYMKKIILTLSIIGFSIIFISCSSAKPKTREEKIKIATVNYLIAVTNQKGEDEIQRAYQEMLEASKITPNEETK